MKKASAEIKAKDEEISRQREAFLEAMKEKDGKIKTLETKIKEFTKTTNEIQNQLRKQNDEIKDKDQEISQKTEAILKNTQEKDDKIKTLEAEIRVLKKQMRSKGTEICELQEINSVKKEKQDKAERDIQRYMTSQQKLQSQLQQLQGRMEGVSWVFYFIFCWQLYPRVAQHLIS